MFSENILENYLVIDVVNEVLWPLATILQTSLEYCVPCGIFCT